MKFRSAAALLLVLSIAFIMAQSFRYFSKKRTTPIPQSYFKSFATPVALCVPVIDSSIDITALKGWGHYQWKISNASDSAQFYFNQGISMYYGFHSIEAIASFTKATHLDPKCAMAWYGKALAEGPTINYPNGYRPPADALEASLKSKQLSGNCTEIEKDLINSIQQRYSADTTINVLRLRERYAEAMRLVYDTHTGNNALASINLKLKEAFKQKDSEISRPVF